MIEVCRSHGISRKASVRTRQFRTIAVTLGALAASFTALALPTSALADDGDPEEEPDIGRLVGKIASTTRPRHRRLDTHLNRLVAQIGKATPHEIAARAPLSREASVAVTVRISGNGTSTTRFLRQAGAAVANVGPDYIESYVPLSKLAALAEMDGVLRVETIVKPHPLVTSQGTTVHNSPVWDARGYNGAGVRVGVIDVGFLGYSSRITEGELPPTVVARCYTAVGTFTSNLADCQTDDVHGTGVAETIADIAPGAELYIANPSSYGDLQSSAAWMVAQGVDVVNMSLSWTWDGPGDGTSPFSNSPVNTVSSTVAGGVVWLNSAGNSAPSNWYGGYSDSDVDQWLEFSSGDETNAVFLQAGESFLSQMRWNDNWGNAAIDLDLYLYDESATEVESSKDEQSGGAGQYPGEGLIFTAPSQGTYYLMVRHFAGGVPSWIQSGRVLRPGSRDRGGR